MKVEIRFTLDVDPEAWTANHGVTGAAEIRKDVRKYVQTDVTDFFRTNGLLVTEDEDTE